MSVFRPKPMDEPRPHPMRQETEGLSDLENVIGAVSKVRLIGINKVFMVDDGTFEGIFTDGGLVGVTFRSGGIRFTMSFHSVILEGDRV